MSKTALASKVLVQSTHAALINAVDVDVCQFTPFMMLIANNVFAVKNDSEVKGWTRDASNQMLGTTVVATFEVIR